MTKIVLYQRQAWVPAFAGMTTRGSFDLHAQCLYEIDNGVFIFFKPLCRTDVSLNSQLPFHDRYRLPF
jgi:hypothetical protein